MNEKQFGEFMYALITMLEAIRLEIRAQSCLGADWTKDASAAHERADYLAEKAAEMVGEDLA